MSRIIKGWRFYPTYDLTIYPAIVSWVLREDTSLLSQRQRTVYQPIALAIARVSALLCQCLEPLCPHGDTKKGEMTPTNTVGGIMGGAEFQESKPHHEHSAWLPFSLE